MLTATPKPIATLDDAIEAAEYALARAGEGCPVLVTPHALRLILDAAKQEAARG